MKRPSTCFQNYVCVMNQAIVAPPPPPNQLHHREKEEEEHENRFNDIRTCQITEDTNAKILTKQYLCEFVK